MRERSRRRGGPADPPEPVERRGAPADGRPAAGGAFGRPARRRLDQDGRQRPDPRQGLGAVVPAPARQQPLREPARPRRALQEPRLERRHDPAGRARSYGRAWKSSSASGPGSRCRPCGRWSGARTSPASGPSGSSPSTLTTARRRASRTCSCAANAGACHPRRILARTARSSGTRSPSTCRPDPGAPLALPREREASAARRRRPGPPCPSAHRDGGGRIRTFEGRATWFTATPL